MSEIESVNHIVDDLINRVVLETTKPGLFMLEEDISIPSPTKNITEDPIEDSHLIKKINELENQVGILSQNIKTKDDEILNLKESFKPEVAISNPIGSKVMPDTVFIVPYRNRRPQQVAFMKIMPHILEDMNYIVLFVHQRDNRPFNRGAMKNLGFIFIKNSFPKNYRNIDFIFHDIDCMPWRKNQFSYKTQVGVVNHFYGFPRALGGIFAIKGIDFQQINGFPNIWTWGLEDNVLLRRVHKFKKNVIRPDFVHTEKGNENIIGLWHGWDRLINSHVENKMKHDNGFDGIVSLTKIKFNPIDMTDTFIDLQILSFETGESLASPYVKGAKIRDARFVPRLNQPFYAPRVKRGTAGTFGKKRGYGGMIM